MLEWLAANLATILVSLALLGLVGAVVAYLVRNKKKGKSSCGCGCANCPMSGSCHHKE